MQNRHDYWVKADKKGWVRTCTNSQLFSSPFVKMIGEGSLRFAYIIKVGNKTRLKRVRLITLWNAPKVPCSPMHTTLKKVGACGWYPFKANIVSKIIQRNKEEAQGKPFIGIIRDNENIVRRGQKQLRPCLLEKYSVWLEKVEVIGKHGLETIPNTYLGRCNASSFSNACYQAIKNKKGKGVADLKYDEWANVYMTGLESPNGPADDKRCLAFFQIENPPVFSIWMEGFRATGEQVDEEFMGEIAANSFQEACLLSCIRKYGLKSTKGHYDPKRNTYHACGFYEGSKPENDG